MQLLVLLIVGFGLLSGSLIYSPDLMEKFLMLVSILVLGVQQWPRQSDLMVLLPGGAEAAVGIGWERPWYSPAETLSRGLRCRFMEGALVSERESHLPGARALRTWR